MYGGVGDSKTSVECAVMVGGEEHDDFVSRMGVYSWAAIHRR